LVLTSEAGARIRDISSSAARPIRAPVGSIWPPPAPICAPALYSAGI
jgi:hypothetical protein